MRPPDQLFRVVDNREVAKSEEVHFEQAKLLDGGHGELGYDIVVLFRERNIVRNGIFRDNHACRVHTRLARHTLNAHGIIEKLLYLRVSVIAFAQLGVKLHGAPDRYIDLARNHLADFIAHSVRQAHYSCDIADSLFAAESAEGDDLDDVVLAVFAHDIIDDLSSALGTEVDIKIGHAYAVGVEEALKNQVVFYRVYLRDTDAVGAQRTCTRTSAGADGNAV